MENYFSSLEHLYFMAFQKIYFSYLEFLTKHLAVFRLLYLQNNIHVCLFVCLMVFNATFNNISVISWRSVLLMEEAEGPRENHWPDWVKLQVTDKLYLIMLYTSPWSRFELTTSVVIGTDCIGIVINPNTMRSRICLSSCLEMKITQNMCYNISYFTNKVFIIEQFS